MCETGEQLCATRLYAGLLAVIWLVLMFGVIAIRATNKVSLGDGGVPTLETRIRGHANFTETAPYFLVVLAISELSSDIPASWIHVAGSVFVVGRFVHCVGFMSARPSTPARIVGTFGAIIPLFSLSMYCMLGWNTVGHVVVLASNAIGATTRLVLIPMCLKPVPGGPEAGAPAGM